MVKRVLRGRMINGIIFGLSTPDRHKHRGNLQDTLKDVAPYQGPVEDVPKPTLSGTKPSIIIVDDPQKD